MGGGVTATRSPGANDDISIGVLPGMVWVDTAALRAWVNVDNTVDAAVWLELATA